MKTFGLVTFFILTCFCSLQAQTETKQRQPAQQAALIEPLLREATQALKNEQFPEAYRKARQARLLSQRRGFKAREARAANLMALAAMSGGRSTEAITLFKEAATLSSEASGDEISKMQVTALERAGRLSRIVGRYEDALWCFHQALQFYRQRNERLAEASMLTNLSAVYADTGDFTKAASTLQDALPIVQRSGNRPAEKSLLTRFMIVERGRGNLTAALQYGEQALAVEVRRGVDPNNKPMMQVAMELHYQLGLLYAALDRHPRAIEMYQLALQAAREFHVPQLLAFSLGEMAWSQLKSGAAKTALDTVTQALTTLRQGGGNKHFESRVLFIRAEAERALGSHTAALTSYRQAIAALEQARTLSIPTEISRAGIVASRHNVFAGAIDFLLSQQYTGEALEVAEAYHARAFLDVLTEAGIESSQELSAEQKDEEDKLFANIASVQKELWQPDLKPEVEAQLNRQLADAEAALDTFRLNVRRANPQYRNVASPPLLKAANIGKDLLSADTALVEFVLSEQKSFAWIIHQDKLVAVTLPPGKEIEALVTAYREELTNKVNSLDAPQAIARQKAQGLKLYQKLWQPLDAHLTTARKLVIVPDGALAYLPFETLVSETKTVSIYLLERYAISYAPSASALAAIQSSATSSEAKGFIAFGDPVYSKTSTDAATTRSFDLKQLPYTRNEVNEIAMLFPPAERRVFLGTDAQEQAVKTEPLRQYRYVHFAAHSNVDEEHPARSGIILSQLADSKEDGMLQMSEVMRLKLHADLVTLSACRTGLGKLLNGEGMIGLTRAFFYAGAESVAVSLWNVNDIATASLMRSFYKHLQQGKAKDEALQAAKLALLKGQQRAWRHPYYWAAFVLAGTAQ
ncbi:MAG TPA: CHAT domain-containing tetratricopeptide repeat protein [Blastocatellia bacterium]|nr:CHAT domain-containing tetratricopeptide repeat protein [Blastocatellia bacterium]